jgi:hypothetical protein
LVDANFFTVAGLETGSVLTFVDIDLSLVVLTATRLFDLDIYFGLVSAARLLNLDVYLRIVSRTVVWEDVGEMRSVWQKIGEMGAMDVWELNVDVS